MQLLTAEPPPPPSAQPGIVSTDRVRAVAVTMGDVMEPSFVQTLAASVTRTAKYLSLSPSFQRCAFMAWIKENIRKKECAYYTEDGREGVCKCGYPKTHHVDEAIKPEEFLGESWDKYRHIREAPTDAFGDISLGGHKAGKYIRVSTDTSSETLYELLTEHWRLRPPNLLISVTGGAKNFYMKTRLKEMFRRGLIKVAQTTGAWIVTGGTHTGVMKHVGMAMRDYTLSSSAFDAQVVAIGVVTWGVLHNREPLVHPEGCFPAHYSLDEQGQGRLSCLDVNHSHFLLVDDGTHGQYGAEIALRSRLEKLISQQPLGQRADGGVKIPVVCVVLEGGPGTLNTIYNAMLNGTPSVILEGSGRVADVIAHAARLPLSQVNIALIRKLMKRFFSKEYESFSSLMIIEWTKKIQDIIRMPHLLTVFRLDEEKHIDLDVAILQALLKASRNCDTPGHESWEQQLELAVAWNRVDIAKSEIFTEESQWKSTDLHRAMLSALVGHKPDFVKLFLANNVSLREFLHEDTLCELYAHLEPGCLFLVLFGFVLVVDFQLTPSWTELLLYLWLMSLVVEEVRQLFDDPDGSGFQKKVKRYINDLWNILDVLSILLFTCGFIFRLITATFYAGKVVLCIDFIIFCLRLMAIFTISKTLGPKIIIVRRMMMDLFFFMFLLSIWVVAFGVAKQGILIQNEDRLEWIMRGVLYEPYLIIFGNVPTDIDRVQFSMDSCTLNGSDPLKPRCPVLATDQTPVFPEWLTIILLCVYLLFANILLLNLLIAIFNYTFQEVQDNTDCFWKFQRYELIKEYHSRPAYPPPFILLSHLYLLVTRFLLCRPSKNKHRQFKQQLSRFEEEEMLSWEALMQENFLAKSRQEQSQSVEYRVQDTSEKVGNLVGMLEVNHNRDTDSMTKRLARLEEQVSRSVKALSWIMNALRSQGYASEEEVPSLTSQRSHMETDPEPANKPTAEGAPCHIKARHLHYPGSQVTRFPVPEEKVPWEVEFTLYNPPVYSTQRTTDSRRKGTPPAGDSDVANLQKYRNPGGRTGLMGRGCLDQLGPNQIHDPVITRWWDGDSPTLEFLAVWEESEGRWAIPGGLVHSDEILPERLERILGKKLCDKIKVRMAEDTRLQTVYKGYVDDDRNTDNAWVETTAFNIHLGSSALLDEMNQTVQRRLVTKESVWWREVSSTALMCAHHKEVLRRVAELHQGAP
ncbi:transient receptor potential cation channel subfamily M member 2 isoform X3 [Paramormyrops kingsleyae]|uniref:transient receptor potential cation channel subfamily M member 2 isoform X3 n=1 Tax=Paramormyrops kingsleyae TaxID=1676925 RepID=UPI003B979FAE